MEFANKTEFGFEPGLSASFAVDAIGTPYATPGEFAEQLGDLARLSYLGAEWVYRVELSGASAGGSADIKLLEGANVVDTVTLDLSTATTFRARRPVDLSQVKGEAQLTVEVEVTAAADAGVTAQVASQLRLTHPVVIGGGRC